MTHEQMMEKAWRFIYEVGISENFKEVCKNANLYYVEDVNQVRDAYYSDLENGTSSPEEDFPQFMKRHGIKWY